MTSKQVLLHVESLCAGYGDSIIIEDIGFSLAAGSSLALLGRNGVGKSTLLRTLLGHARQRSGVIRFNGHDISATTPYARIWQGLGWVPQERLMFPSLTVAEHLAIADRKGAWTCERLRPVSAAEGTAAQSWRTALRRRTADARHCARPDDQSDAAAAR
jgi:branched-chain amino acid transport system ATP-binding protein